MILLFSVSASEASIKDDAMLITRMAAITGNTDIENKESIPVTIAKATLDATPLNTMASTSNISGFQFPDP
ncbi:hypothetical protein D3C72_2483210 [compost metagenome]